MSVPLHDASAVHLHVRPTHHLQRADDAGTWDIVGNDPRFRVEPSAPIVAGWYAVEMDMEAQAGPEMRSFFYPDYGGRDLEKDKVFLPLSGGPPRRCVALFEHDVIGLRFDPSMAVGRFRLGGIRLRRIGRLAAARDMFGALMARETSLGGRFRRAAELVGALAGGASRFAERLYARYSERPDADAAVPYRIWVELYDSTTQDVVEASRERLGRLRAPPRISIVLPVYDTAEQWLRRCVDSVRAQVYDDWELCIADDASPSPHVWPMLQDMAASDPRIRVMRRDANGHISASSNSAIGLATGQWLALLDHDDELHPLALLEVAEALERNPRWRLVYSDEDKIDEDGQRFDPYMKPDWNYDLFLSHNCISHLGVYEAGMVRALGGFREGMEGSQDWDLALRCIETLDADQIGHVPRVLYHWRAIAGSTALAPQEKNYAHLAGVRAIAAHLERTGSRGRVLEIEGQRGNYRVAYALPDPAPMVSILIPTRDGVALLRSCIDSVLGTTRYPDYEIVVVDNQSSDPVTLDYLASLGTLPRVRVLRYDAPFNYSRINNFAASEARGDVLCLLNNDVTVISPGWLEEMTGHACRQDVGAVGAMLYYPNDTIQHAGVIIGAHGVAAHAYSGRGRGPPRPLSRARLSQERRAVTAAGLGVRRAVYEQAGGLDPNLQVAFNDIDFCLRLRELGYRNVWTPFAELYHHESATRGYEDSPEKLARFEGEIAYMRSRWPDVIAHDPAYSLNHSISDELHELAFPPRTGAPGAEAHA